jgi:prepilin-type N-terminal cleavage/methylation domain-containing protein
MIKIKKSGFTLIELLISMTIIAILAMGIFYFLDPVELIRKSKDITRISNSKEFAKVIQIFHTNNVNLKFPWNMNSDDGYRTMVRSEESAFAYDPKVSDFDFTWAYSMVETGDLSESLYKKFKTNDEFIVLKEDGIDATTWVCFEPESKHRKKEAAQSCVTGERLVPHRIRNVTTCDTSDGTIPAPDSTMRNLFCLTF